MWQLLRWTLTWTLWQGHSIDLNVCLSLQKICVVPVSQIRTTNSVAKIQLRCGQGLRKLLSKSIQSSEESQCLNETQICFWFEMYKTKAIAKREQNGRYQIITIERGKRFFNILNGTSNHVFPLTIYVQYFYSLYIPGQTSEFDVDIAIKYCGVSPFADVHLANYDWGSVPGLCAVVGHEISGVVSR